MNQIGKFNVTTKLPNVTYPSPLIIHVKCQLKTHVLVSQAQPRVRIGVKDALLYDMAALNRALNVY